MRIDFGSGRSLSPPRISSSVGKLRGKSLVDPKTQQYLSKYKEYLELKNKKVIFEEAVERVKREKWDTFTKGPESPHKKGKELHEMYSPPADHKCEFSVCSVKFDKPDTSLKAEVTITRPESEFNASALGTLKEKDKDSFLVLREFYNSLDEVF